MLTAIKVGCLSLGLASAQVIASYLYAETSYDTHLENYRNVYRVTVSYQEEGQLVQSARNFSPLAEILANNLAGVSSLTRIFPVTMFVADERRALKTKEDRFCFVDSSFFEIFQHRILEGSATTSLISPFSVAISESTARKLFGKTEGIIGRELVAEDNKKSYSFTISAVFGDAPETSHFQPEYVASFSSLKTIYPHYDNWHYPPMFVYIETDLHAQVRDVALALNRLAFQNQPDYLKEENRKYELQNIADIHLHSNLSDEWKANSSILYVKIFFIIGLVIIMLACINYINISNSTAAVRLREVGVRKAIGAGRWQLVGQFMIESFVVTVLAFIIGLVASELGLRFLLPGVVDVTLTLEYLLNPAIALSAILFLLFIALSAGLYPAIFITAFRTLTALNGRSQKGFKVSLVTRLLVLFQFIVSSLMVVVSLLVYEQMQFLEQKDLGFARDEIAYLRMPDLHSSANAHVLKTKLLSESRIVAASVTSTVPGGEEFYSFPVTAEGHEQGKQLSFLTLGVDEDFIDTYGLTVLLGRQFYRDIRTDEREAFVLNESAASLLGWQDPVGKRLAMSVYTNKEDIRSGKVIGVVKDFHFKSLYDRIQPIVIYINKHIYYTDYLSMRLRPGDFAQVKTVIQKHWKNFNPDKPMELSFIDEKLENQYRTENSRSQLLVVFTLISLVIAALGLFALTANAAAERRREICIRKILGASPLALYKLLSRQQVIILIIASIVAAPLAWYSCDLWMSSFAYRVNHNIFFYPVAFVILALVSGLTMLYHCRDAVLSNPVDSLRND